MREIFKWSRACVALAAAFSVGAFAGNAHADTFSGTPGDGVTFENADNWTGGIFPGNLAVNQRLAEIDGAFTVTRAGSTTVDRTFVSGGATLNVTGGTNTDGRSGNTIRNFVGFGSTGTVNQSGGVYNIGHIAIVGGSNANGDGTYNLTGGDLSIFRGGNSFIGITGGSSLEIGVGGATGEFVISGGSLETRIGVGVGSGGTFEVIGTGASSISLGGNGSLDGEWTQDAGSILRTGIDATGITPIDVVVTSGTGSGLGDATFAAGSILDPYDAGGAAANVWTTVLSWDGTLFGAPTLSSTAAAAGWIQRFDGPNLQVQLVSTIPEPSSLALLGLGGLALVGRRRK